MKKIALITPMLQPYRISFYEKLFNMGEDYQWKIFHGVSQKEDGRPNYDKETNFDQEGFRETIYRPGPFKIVYNKGLFTSIKEFNPDLLILQGITGDISNRRAISWAKREGKRIIVWTCGWEPGLAKGMLLSFKNLLVSAFFKKGDLHLTYSTTASDYVESMGVDPQNIITAYNGIEIDHLIAEENKVLAEARKIIQELELNQHTTFIYVGGLIPEKRVDLLLNAFKALRQKKYKIKLIIIGDGPLREDIQQMMEDINDPNIIYLGRIIEGVDPYFAASDCYVLPGVGGLGLNQAMFWKKTCIVSEADGTENDLVIESETGFRFSKDDLQSLTEAMERRINTSPAEIRKMSAKCREIIETKSNVNAMVKVFSESVIKLLSQSN
ncbi:MAG: glycosyltransferase [Bacteroidales bacterium]